MKKESQDKNNETRTISQQSWNILKLNLNILWHSTSAKIEKKPWIFRNIQGKDSLKKVLVLVS